jgi:hypothetical protein
MFQKYRQGLYSDTKTTTTANHKIKMQYMCNVKTKMIPVMLVPTG